MSVPARMPIHFTFLCMQVRCLKRKHDRSQVFFLADVDRFPCALGIVALSDYSQSIIAATPTIAPQRPETNYQKSPKPYVSLQSL